jgi:hypothetical protein
MFWPRWAKLIKENSAAMGVLIEKNGSTTYWAVSIRDNEMCSGTDMRAHLLQQICVHMRMAATFPDVPLNHMLFDPVDVPVYACPPDALTPEYGQNCLQQMTPT